jgi:hypothetical protein
MCGSRNLIFVCLFSICVPGMVSAVDSGLDKVLQQRAKTVQAIARHSLVVGAVEQQNKARLSRTEIAERDRAWQVDAEMTGFKQSMMESPIGAYLRAKVEGRSLIYNEAIVTDAKGANVACFPASSDYWQGDEDKFVKAFNNGEGAVYVGPVQLDESTQTESAQIAVPVRNAKGQAIGVLIMGIRLSFAAQRSN